MTCIAIKVSNGVSLRRFWLLKDAFTEAVGAFVDISIVNIDDMWAYCDVDIDDGDNKNSLAAKRLYEYIESIPMQEVVVDWETMSDITCENCGEDDE